MFIQKYIFVYFYFQKEHVYESKMSIGKGYSSDVIWDVLTFAYSTFRIWEFQDFSSLTDSILTETRRPLGPRVPEFTFVGSSCLQIAASAGESLSITLSSRPRMSLSKPTSWRENSESISSSCSPPLQAPSTGST